MTIEAARAELLGEDAWSFGKEHAPRTRPPAPPYKDPRKNAPPRISDLHGAERMRVLAGRAESYRRSHLAGYDTPPRVARQRDSFALRYEYWWTGALVFIVAFIAGGLL